MNPLLVISLLACVISVLSAAMAWLAIKHNEVVWKSHLKLHEEFWRQSLLQAEQNGKQWGCQLKTLEQLQVVLTAIGAPPPKSKPAAPPN